MGKYLSARAGAAVAGGGADRVAGQDEDEEMGMPPRRDASRVGRANRSAVPTAFPRGSIARFDTPI